MGLGSGENSIKHCFDSLQRLGTGSNMILTNLTSNMLKDRANLLSTL